MISFLDYTDSICRKILRDNIKGISELNPQLEERSSRQGEEATDQGECMQPNLL